MDVRPLKTPADHAWALREIEAGMNAGVLPGTPEGDRLDVLMTLADAYEREHHPIAPADPIDAIVYRMEQQHLRVSDLLAVFGTRGRASEILHKRRRMSLDMMRGLHGALGIPLETLARDYELKPAKRKPARAGKRSPKKRAA